MDAISFVLGVRTNQLRGSQLRDLIHKADTTQPTFKSAYVELVYVSSSGSTIRFRRSINGTTGIADYGIDGKFVKADTYHQHLKTLGINARTKNFLVFQGDVEQIAQKSPKELTQLFEQISGSSETENGYNSLKEKMETVEEELLRTFDKKRNIAKEKKQMKEQKEEAERQTLRELKEQLNEKKTQLKNSEADLKEKSKNTAQFRRDLLMQEKETTKHIEHLERLRPTQIKVKEQIAFLKKILESCQSQALKAEVEVKKKEAEIKALEQDLKNVERMRQDFERSRPENSSIKATTSSSASLPSHDQRVARHSERSNQHLQRS